MIKLDCGLNPKNRIEIKDYCLMNNIEISYFQCLDYGKYGDFYSLELSANQAKQFEKFLEKLK